MKMLFHPTLATLTTCICLVSFSFSIPTAGNEQQLLSSSTSWEDRSSDASPSRLGRLVSPLVNTLWPARSRQTQKPQNLHLGSNNGHAKYVDDIVLRFLIKDDSDAQAFSEAVDTLYLDVWETNQDWVDVRLSRKVLDLFLDLLPEHMRLSYAPIITNVAQAIYDTYPAARSNGRTQRHAMSESPPPDLFFENYQALSVIYPYLHLMAELYRDRARLFSIGTSYEGRDIPAFEIGLPQEGDDSTDTKQTIVVLAGLHAREWVSTSTAMYLLRTLLHGPGHSNRFIEKLLRHYDFVILPVMNPDGYDFTWTTDRLWRKNRQDTSLPFCRGIDLDRAFSVGWDGDSKVENPCSESYAGEYPLAATESQRLVEWATNETEAGRSFEAFIDLHSYSERILYPYSYTCDQPPRNLEDLEEIAFGLAKAFRVATGHFYAVDSACEGTMSVKTPSSVKGAPPIRTKIEESGGSALDYFYQHVQVKYAYQIKLRDTGTYGFLLPKENIVPAGRESFSALMAFGRWLLGNRGIEEYTDLSSDEIWGEDTHDLSDIHKVHVEATKDEQTEEEESFWWRRRRR